MTIHRTCWTRIAGTFTFLLSSLIGAPAEAAQPFVTIKSVGGVAPNGYVVATSTYGAKADGTWDDSAIEFAMEDAGNGAVHFRSTLGRYLVALDGGGAGVKADREVADTWETFTLEGLPTGPWRIRTYNGSYLCAKLDGRLDARACQFPDSQLFDVVERGEVLDLGFSNILHQAQIDEHTWTYEADLRLPTPAGDFIFPGAVVEITYDPVWGGVESISGTTGMPIAPGGSGCSLWCSFALGNRPATTAPVISIGYARPSTFNDTFELPLKDDRRYFYLELASGHQASWGNLSFSTPDSGAVQVVVDHHAPALFFYTDFPYGLGEFTGPLESVGFGVSRGNQIPFEPARDTGVTQWMEPFDGDVYLGGDINLSPVEGLNLVLESDVVVDVNTDPFLNGGPFIARLGYNGALTYGAELGPLSVSFKLADGSLYYRTYSWGLRRIVLSGKIKPRTPIGGLPFQMESNASIWGLFDNDPWDSTDSFIHLEGELDFGSQFSRQKIEGFIEISENGGSFDGTAKFSGTTVHVEGSITPGRAQFEGSFSHNWDIGGGKVKTTVTAAFDTHNTEVELDLRAQFCENLFNHCDSASGSASVNGTGELRLCVNIPGIGTECDTL